MQRTRLLAELIVTVTVAAAVIALASALPVALLFSRGLGLDGLALHFARQFLDGALDGLWLALPIALATLVLFRRPSQLKRYRLAVVLIALVVALVRWGWIIELANFALAQSHLLTLSIVGRQLLTIALYLVACRVAAGRYRRKVLTREDKPEAA